jgi:hypothetical protein
MNDRRDPYSWWPHVKAFLERLLTRWMESAMWLESDAMLCCDPQMAAFASANDHEPFEWHV